MLAEPSESSFHDNRAAFKPCALSPPFPTPHSPLPPPHTPPPNLTPSPPDPRSPISTPHSPPLIILWNKTDLAPLPSPAPQIPGGRLIGFSAKTGEGLATLTGAVAGALEGLGTMACTGTAVSSLGIGTERQKELIDRAIAGLEEALGLAGEGGPLDLIAPALRESLDALGEITGEVSSAEVLETLFSRFCVGK